MAQISLQARCSLCHQARSVKAVKGTERTEWARVCVCDLCTDGMMYMDIY